MELKLGDKFKIIKKIGSGAFGEIYKGKKMDRVSLLLEMTQEMPFFNPP